MDNSNSEENEQYGILIVGPRGDFDDEEMQTLMDTCETISLVPFTFTNRNRGDIEPLRSADDYKCMMCCVTQKSLVFLIFSGYKCSFY